MPTSALSYLSRFLWADVGIGPYDWFADFVV